jgi:hypothetical protein
MKHADKFFEYARKRHQIFLDREAGLPKPWTRDKILQNNPFCCVFREHDRTTRWFARQVRVPMRDRPEVLLATVVFRMFNRITTGEAIFCQQMLPSSRFKKNETTAFDIFAATGDPDILRKAILALMPTGPYVTGAYIISSPPGYTKLEGVLEVLSRFHRESREWEGWGASVLDPMRWGGEEGVAQFLLANRGDKSASLETTWEWLKKFDYLGKFHSYEIVTDLRHTALLECAPDIMTWASPGPGARRGLNRVWGRDFRDHSQSREQMIEDMRALLSLAKRGEMWPRDWPTWEMREVEHTLCEFDKYERMRLGQGRMKGKYDGR